MNFKGHPFDGLSGVEACKRIYSPNKTYNEDAEEIEEILGGMRNFKSIEIYDDKERMDYFPNATSYLIKLNDLEQTKFIKENFKTRAIGGTAFLSLEDKGVIITATGVLRDGLQYILNYFDFEKYEYREQPGPKLVH